MSNEQNTEINENTTSASEPGKFRQYFSFAQGAKHITEDTPEARGALGLTIGLTLVGLALGDFIGCRRTIKATVANRQPIPGTLFLSKEGIHDDLTDMMMEMQRRSAEAAGAAVANVDNLKIRG